MCENNKKGACELSTFLGGYEKSEVFIYALVSIFVVAKAKEIIGGYLLIILRKIESLRPRYSRSWLVSSRPWLSGLRL